MRLAGTGVLRHEHTLPAAGSLHTGRHLSTDWTIRSAHHCNATATDRSHTGPTDRTNTGPTDRTNTGSTDRTNTGPTNRTNTGTDWLHSGPAKLQPVRRSQQSNLAAARIQLWPVLQMQPRRTLSAVLPARSTLLAGGRRVRTAGGGLL